MRVGSNLCLHALRGCGPLVLLWGRLFAEDSPAKGWSLLVVPLPGPRSSGVRLGDAAHRTVRRLAVRARGAARRRRRHRAAGRHPLRRRRRRRASGRHPLRRRRSDASRLRPLRLGRLGHVDGRGYHGRLRFRRAPPAHQLLQALSAGLRLDGDVVLGVLVHIVPVAVLDDLHHVGQLLSCRLGRRLPRLLRRRFDVLEVEVLTPRHDAHDLGLRGDGVPAVFRLGDLPLAAQGRAAVALQASGKRSAAYLFVDAFRLERRRRHHPVHPLLRAPRGALGGDANAAGTAGAADSLLSLELRRVQVVHGLRALPDCGSHGDGSLAPAFSCWLADLVSWLADALLGGGNFSGWRSGPAGGAILRRALCLASSLWA
ncbi:hypothetical protein MTO96_016423 [Rhipicephalus appendiculatus]